MLDDSNVHLELRKKNSKGFILYGLKNSKGTNLGVRDKGNGSAGQKWTGLHAMRQFA